MSKPHDTPKYLSATHRRQLEDSGISSEVAARRGYWTVRQRSEVPSEFKDYQRRAPALVVPMYSPDDKTTGAQLRPDKPRQDKKEKPIKYETAGGSRIIADVHPSNMERVQDATAPLWVGEGIKKGDSLASRGECALSLIGVWCWIRDGELLPCFDHVALKDRRVYIVFDSDVMCKPEVQLALERLVAALERRGADVRVIYLPEGKDGEKVGVDDYLAGGGTIAELKALARRFEPGDMGRIRLSRDQRLRGLIEDLDRTFWGHEWKGQGGHSDRDLFKVLIDLASGGGKVHPDGVRVRASYRTLQALSKISSSRTLGKGLDRLEDAGLCYRDNDGRKDGQAGAFVLRASVKQIGERTASEGIVTEGLQVSHPSALHLRAPRLRWSSPGSKPRRGVVKGTRRVRQGVVRKARPAIRRLGKGRGAALDALDASGGTLMVPELAAALHKPHARDLTRRKRPGSKGRDGLLVMLEEAGLVTVEDGRVSLTPDWLDRLEEVRDAGGEIEAEELDRERYADQRAAYRNRHKVKLDPHWTNDRGADGAIEHLRPVDEPEPEKPEPEEDPAAEIVLDYITRLGKIRLGLLEEIWLEDHGGDLRELRRAIDASGVRKEHLREYLNALFLYPPIGRRAA